MKSCTDAEPPAEGQEAAGVAVVAAEVSVTIQSQEAV